jgi:gliding motility-associated lipoprotein GldH
MPLIRKICGNWGSQMINNKMFKVFLLFFVSFLVCSCTSSEYEKSYHIDDESWTVENTLQFNIDVHDTYHRYNLYFNIRNSDVYSYSNIYMFVNVLYPDNTLMVDTVEGILADSKGKWLGKGSGKYRSSKFLYKSNVAFPQTGKYVFTVEQAMRDEALKGIASVGVEMKKIKSD